MVSWGLMGAKAMRGRTEVSCARGRHLMKMKKLNKLKVYFAENTPAVKMLCSMKVSYDLDCSSLRRLPSYPADLELYCFSQQLLI